MNNIFISSPFADMQAERDAIRQIVLPEINEFLRENYGQETTIIDLRWGIDTTSDFDDSASMQKILRTCLLEIQDCQPFMLVFLGDRYGTIADSSLINQAISTIDDFSVDDNIGVTELEIRYAMHIAKKDKMHLFFYLRDMDYASVPEEKKAIFFDQIDTEEKQNKLRILKHDILCKYKDNCRNYKTKWNRSKQKIEGLNSLAEQVVTDLKACIQIELGHHKKNFLNIDQSFMQSKRACFIGRDNELQFVRSFLDNSDSNIALIRGDTGTGKSTLVANIPLRINNVQYSFIPIFCGHGNNSDSSIGIMQKVILSIYELLDRPYTTIHHLTEEDCHKEMDDVIEKYHVETGKTLIIMIDAIDQMIQDMSCKKLFFLPTTHLSQVKIILTATTDYNIDYTLPTLLDLCEITMSDPSEPEIQDMINQIWRKYGKYSVSQDVHSKLVSKPLAKNYLYVNLLVNRLTLLGESVFGCVNNSAAYISISIQNIIIAFPDTIDEAVHEYLRVVGEINTPLAEQVFTYLSLSQNGLRICDLEALCGEIWNFVDFVLIKRLLGTFLYERTDHRIDYSHKVLRQNTPTFCNNSAQTFYNKYAHYAFTLPTTDNLAVEYVVHSAVCSRNYSALYSKIPEWRESNIAKEKAAVIIVQMLSDQLDLAKQLAKNFPAETFCEDIVRFFADNIGPLLDADKGSVEFLESISNKLHSSLRLTALSADQLEVIKRLEYIKHRLGSIYNDNPSYGLDRYQQCLELIANKKSDNTSNYRYAQFLLTHAKDWAATGLKNESDDWDVYPVKVQGICNKCLQIAKKCSKIDKLVIQMQTNILRADIEYGRFFISRKNSAEKYLRKALKQIDYIAQLAKDACSRQELIKYLLIFAEAYKHIGDIYIRIRGIRNTIWENISTLHSISSDAASLYRFSRQIFMSCRKELFDQQYIESLTEVLCQEITLQTDGMYGIYSDSDQQEFSEDLAIFMNALENRIYTLLQSHTLSRNYAVLCGIQADLSGANVSDSNPWDSNYTQAEGYRLLQVLEEVDFWHIRQIKMLQHIAHATANQKDIWDLCDALKNRIKILNWYGYRSKETLILQFNNQYGFDFNSLSRRFRYPNDLQEDIDYARRKCGCPANFAPDLFVRNLLAFRDSLKADIRLLNTKKISTMVELCEMLIKVASFKEDIARGLFLCVASKLLSYYSVLDDVAEQTHLKRVSIEKWLVNCIEFAIEDQHSFSWFCICRNHKSIPDWSFRYVNQEKLQQLATKANKLQEVYSHPDEHLFYDEWGTLC